MQITTSLADGIAAYYKAQLDGGFLYVFSGPIPESAEDALDMFNDHTQLAFITESDDGVTGLTWDAPVDGVLVKPTIETWEGLNAFDGADDGSSTLTATFARLCPSGDDGRGAATSPRLQFRVSGPTGNGEMILSNASVQDNGVLKTRVDFARIAQGLG